MGNIKMKFVIFILTILALLQVATYAKEAETRSYRMSPMIQGQNLEDMEYAPQERIGAEENVNPLINGIKKARKLGVEFAKKRRINKNKEVQRIDENANDIEMKSVMDKKLREEELEEKKAKK